MQNAQQPEPVRQNLVEDEVLWKFSEAPGPHVGRAEVRATPTQVWHSREQINGGLESLDKTRRRVGVPSTQIAQNVENVARDEIAFLNGKVHQRMRSERRRFEHRRDEIYPGGRHPIFPGAAAV